ncbi:MAG: hypothetical protein AAF638_13405 [Pseudomonadota bacterium]
MLGPIFLLVSAGLGIAAGLHSMHWGGLAVAVLLTALYFMMPAAVRNRLPERYAFGGIALVIAVSAALWPVLGVINPTP